MNTLPDLPYAYNALEPHVDEATMKVHHDKHHQAYLTKYLAAIESHDDLLAKPVEAVLSDLDSVPEDIRTAVRNNGGGYFHHTLFFEMMSPDGGGQPTGELAKAIDETFGDFDSFKQEFTNAALTVFGSGWVWLVKDAEGRLSILQTSNQDSPVTKGLIPLIGIDVWEHAYYLKYQNRRPDFIEAWWNVVNWVYAEKAYAEK
ncbi:superoxide dismutase [Patescibacteria group bacterium]|nr:superoxide dismutase [Patescibacteria group bacterium]